ncbi:hypothetical protein E1301_Tti017633 [Triplophysa tibetana]|uniref:Uncharacterized protein n=1 Tax=Triplophysa tibetana TaxID=1572043 RepID=A0A5A9NIM3_9TELE|nr:hypothetical protein E1301_Tti017633 [Triplophysa tibetana]
MVIWILLWYLTEARCLEAIRSLPTLAPNIYKEFKEGKITVRQTEGRFNGVWKDMALEKTYKRDAKTKLFNGISQQPVAMEKYLKALPVLTAVSEQKRLWHTWMRMTLNTRTRELLNISTGHKAISADLIYAREKGLEALAAARRTHGDKVAQMKLSTFAAKPKKSMSMAFKAKMVYEEESAVVRNVSLVQDLEEHRKVKVFGHEWTSWPACLSKIRLFIKVRKSIKETRQTTWLQSRQPLAAEGKCTNYSRLTSLL